MTRDWCDCLGPNDQEVLMCKTIREMRSHVRKMQLAGSNFDLFRLKQKKHFLGLHHYVLQDENSQYQNKTLTM